MRLRVVTTAAILLCLVRVASAHRLDEYLQATILSVDKDHVQASMRMIPGVAVASAVIASIDSNGDGLLSPAEQRAYAERVLGDLSLTVDGKRVQPKLVSVDFPQVELMREGLGEIHIEFTADLPHGGPDRKFILENHHQRQNAAYLVNCLVPRDPDIRIVGQTRNERQSFYQLDYVQAGGPSQSRLSQWWTNVRESMSALGFASIFRLGMRHIAEGTDHLLFLLVLLLPAPLIVSGSRWAGFSGARSSVLRILSIVTAFTIGHSITLAFAAFGIVRVPSRPIEVLIAVSILVSAIHALRPIFPGQRGGHRGVLRAHSRFGVCRHPGRTGARPVGACGRYSCVQPGYRNHADGRGRRDYAVSDSHKPHPRVHNPENRWCAFCGFCVRGLDR
jgi:HupE / UreJ protein